jgi:hypothetical protein
MDDFAASKNCKHLMAVRIEAASIQRLVMETDGNDAMLRLTNTLISIVNAAEDLISMQASEKERERLRA